MRGFSVVLFFVVVATVYGYVGYSKGIKQGHEDYYKGKVECVEVFNKIECRLKPNNS